MRYNFFKVLIFFSTFIIYFNLSLCQGVAIGQWREHLPYKNFLSIVDAGDKIYSATPYALVVYDKEDNSITRLSKVNKLNDIGLTKIAYHNNSKTIIIAYSNGNIDLLTGETVRNLSDIKRSNVQGSKKINNISVYENFAYLSCDFGIVVLDLTRKEIKDSYFIGINGKSTPVYDIDILNDTIYAGTNTGLFYANVNSPNLSDYSNWNIDSSMISENYVINIVHKFNNYLFINISQDTWDTDTSFYKKNNEWIKLPEFRYSNKGNFYSDDEIIAIAQSGAVLILDTALQEKTLLWYFNDNYLMPNDLVKDKNDDKVWWIADSELGIVKNTDIWTNQFINPRGPYTNNIFTLTSADGIIVGVPGARNPSWGNVYLRGGYFAFYNENWISKSTKNVTAFDTIYDILSVVVDPQNTSKIYLGSFGKGIIEFTNNQLTTIYDRQNTDIGGTPGLDNHVRVGGMTFDDDNNLWVAIASTNECISVKTKNGEWYTYDFPIVTSNDVVSEIIVDKNNSKWLAIPRGGGILVFNENKTFDNRADDRYKRLSTAFGNGKLPSMTVNCLAMDKDGRIWVGTDKGIAVFYYPQNVFTNQNFDAQQILVEVGGYVQPLLEAEVVTSIVVDGANRKWIGTEKGGVFLLSADGTRQISHFTTNNSPLLSNSISSIAIMPESGEVFFGTYEGLISYKGTATEGRKEYVDSVNTYAFPNPVSPNYSGPIAVRNLVYNSNVKITDIYGNLVLQTEALGGQVVWNGLLPNGQRPNSGVYLVFATDSDGTETIVTKILFIQ